MKQARNPIRSISRALQALVWVAALTVVGCDSSVNLNPVEPEWPRGQWRLLMVSGNDQTGTVGQPLEAPFVVQVVDQRGTPISGASILWDIVEGSGDLPDVPRGLNDINWETKTDDRGYVSVFLTLGSQPGRNVVDCRLLFDADRMTFVANGRGGG